MQEDFYKNTICNRNARARFWGIYVQDRFIGMTGLENIEWENSCAEISIILDPEIQGRGYGGHAVDMLLNKGFDYMGLETIYGECYECNPAIDFWHKIANKYRGNKVYLPNRKYWKGEFHDSMYFSIDREDYNHVANNT
jgi:RimJ/RimL family protein N-acetyltransferase